MRFIRTLPPIRRASGFSSIDGKVYTVTVESGQVTAPQGGSVDATGTVFRVPDITKRPADGEITLQAAGPITAALSLLDQKPFTFLAKAGRPVDLAEGHARITAEIRTPLRRKVPLSEVDYEVEGTLSDLRSDKLAPGRVLTARELTVSANRAGLTIAGEGFLGTLPFNASWRQDFGPEHRGKSRVEATVSLDHTFLDELKIALPRGAVSGAARARVTLDMTRGEPTRYYLGSDLAGATLAIPELGWSKTAGSAGMLEIFGTLGQPATVEALRLAAAGLEAEGDLTLRDGGGLDQLRLSKVKVGGWLDGTVEAMGQGAGKPMAISVTSGTIDLRRRTSGTGGSGAGALDLALDRLVVSDAIALTGFRGRFSTGGGLSGKFTARVNGEVPVEGAVSPENGRSAVRILSEDAGAVFAAAGVYPNGRGGAMDLVLRPRAEAGEFDGTLAVTGARVRNTPVLAELLNLISVVGALDQLQNSGLYFSTVDARFRLTPAAVEITQASAVGPSMGISMAGLYRLSDKVLDIQGVISPVYIVNGIGQIFARRGEGLFGFNYRVAGPAAAPKVSVNPLSFLTPGMFREIFRRPPPKLAQ
ncbi:MAG: AsmA-like C-terminal region-containing protein [Paracoccaceae bacterium]